MPTTVPSDPIARESMRSPILSRASGKVTG